MPFLLNIKFKNSEGKEWKCCAYSIYKRNSEKKSKKMVQAFLPLRNFPGCVWGSHHCLSRDHITWPLTVCLLAHLPSGLCPLLEALLLPEIAAASFPLVILPYGRSGSCVGLRALGGQGSTLSFSVSPWIAATSLLAL